ncbi:hypothetical protein [Mycobacterium sp. 852002-51961_SCH5331710]|uniref:hypothetical protein n=1 Tax=Mycobacterium sp. 852002-51961_SCH5331710 TaxID=1834105 RepID=UPI000800F441|nr:hypothetical protein [Mycobacterium sp. 852002-51961_SCH5331710]OBB48352.1 hypothetical protein A5752_22115 [Mycobacterium sp. 852002-51961_SCH5331710]
MTDLCELPAHTLVALMVGSEVACREVQIAARPWEDATVLAVAARLETALGGWRPPRPVA